MIQEIAPHIYHNEYRPAPPQDQDYVMIYAPGQVFLKCGENGISYLTVEEFARALPEEKERLQYLFSVDERRFYLAQGVEPAQFTAFHFEKLSFLRTAFPQHLAFAGVTGHQLAQWYRSRRFCGHCGAPMKHSQTERMMFCERCGLQEYPKICPAVIVGIRNGEKLLVSKYEGRSYKRYALIAGFAEIGETIEETVRREVMEEVGLKVKNITFYRSQPWSFSDTLLMGFYCDLDGTDEITLDRSELALAEWKERAQVPDEGENISLTKEMMLRFKNDQDCEMA